MISILVKSAIVLAIAAGIAVILRRQSAALRHAIWTAGLIGALVVPLCSITLPSWQNGIVGKAESLFQPRVQPEVNDQQPAAGYSNGNNPVAAGTASVAVVADNDANPVPVRRWSYSQIAVVVWILGAAAGLLLMLLGAGRLAWVAIRAEPVQDPRLMAAAEDVRRSIALRRPVRLLQSPGHFLGTWGILVPRVLLPEDARTWSDDRLWMVMGHELAHIQRHDWVVQVLAEAARAIYWFNPIFWISYSRLRRESEHACDDAVIRMGAAGTRYAEELLEVARALRSEGHLKSPILAMAQPSHLEIRLVALLNPALNRLAATPWSIVVVALVAIGLTLPLAAVRAPEKIETRHAAAVAPAVAIPVVPTPATSNSPKIEIPKRELPSAALQPKLEAPAAIGDPVDIHPDVPVRQVLIAKLDAPNVAPPPFECRVTASIPMKSTGGKTAPLGSGPWHVSGDGLIQTWDQPFVAGTRVNTMWMRPANADLVITGRRLDGDASPLQVQLAKDGSAGYIATSLSFPAAGCWEVTATAGASTLTFITRVDAQ